MCIFLITCSTCFASAISYTTDSFFTDIQVKENSSMHITETIDVNFESPAHGIYRYIYTSGYSYMYEDGEVVPHEMVYAIKHIKCRGEEVDVTSEDGYVQIRIGDADRLVTGPHRYDIEYDVVMYGDDMDDKDYLYWNVTPSYWETDIEKTGFRVVMPKEFDHSKVDLIEGEVGGGESTTNFAVNGNTIEGEAEGYVGYGYGMTLAVLLPEGYWQGVKNDTPFGYAYAALYTLLASVIAVLFFKFGKDGKIVRTVEFYPPDNITPAEMGYLLDNRADEKDIVSMVLWFASEGYLKINQVGVKKSLRGKETPEIELEKLRDLEPSAPAYQTVLFDGLFAEGDQVFMNDKYLPDDFGDDFEDSRTLLKSEFEADKATVEPSSIVALTVSLLILLILFFSMLIPVGVLHLKDSLLDGILGYCIVVLFVCGFFMLKMLKPTAYRTRMLGRILGFREFIKKAELDKINALVEQDPEYFYNILPYAYVFGLTDKWAKHFEAISLKAPDWYYGDPYYMTHPMIFCNTFQNSISREIVQAHTAAMAAHASSSSGGSSGGVSGGGGGGGGGGAW
ncbi:MAG: DUF2207 domain-containing protein [Clostridia bacterium]|nr:DUF2207 domain-containing protein [Clostridia bacterium]